MLVHYSVSWLGFSELSVRLPAYSAGLFSMAAFFLLSRKLGFNSFLTILALITVALSPVHIAYSQDARGYSLMILWTTLVLIGFIEYHKGSFIKGTLYITFSSILAFLTIPSCINFIAALFIAEFFMIFFQNKLQNGQEGPTGFLQRHAPLIGLFFCGIIIISIFSAVYIPLLSNENFGREEEFGINLWRDPLGFPREIFEVFRLIFRGAYLFSFLFFTIGCFVSYRQRREFLWLAIAVIIIPGIFYYLVGIAGPARAHLYLFPFIIVMVVMGFDFLIRRFTFTSGKIFFYLTTFLWIFLLGRQVVLGNFINPLLSIDYKAVAPMVKRNLGPHDLIISSRFDEEVAKIYLPVISENVVNCFLSKKINNLYALEPKVSTIPATLDGFDLLSNVHPDPNNFGHYNEIKDLNSSEWELVDKFGDSRLLKLKGKPGVIDLNFGEEAFNKTGWKIISDNHLKGAINIVGQMVQMDNSTLPVFLFDYKFNKDAILILRKGVEILAHSYCFLILIYGDDAKYGDILSIARLNESDQVSLERLFFIKHPFPVKTNIGIVNLNALFIPLEKGTHRLHLGVRLNGEGKAVFFSPQLFYIATGLTENPIKTKINLLP